MKKVYFEEENRAVRPIKRFGLWLVNVGVFVLLGILSAAALCMTVAML